MLLPILALVFASAPPVADPLPAGAIARLGSTRLRHGFLLYALAFSHDGKVIASGGNGRGLCLWDARTGALLHHCSTRRFPSAYSVAFDPPSRKVICAEGGGLILWDAATGKELRRFEGHTNGVISTAYAPDGTWLASGSHDQTVRLWSPQTGKTIRVLEGHRATPWGLAAHPAGRELASGDLSGEIIVWDVATGKLRWRAFGHTMIGGQMTIAYDPRGEWLASCGDGTVRLWRASDGRPGRVIALGEKKSRAITFARDGRLAVNFDNEIAVYDPATGKQLARWRSGEFAAQALAFSPDGKALASGGVWRTAVDLWDSRTGRPLRELVGHGGPVDYLRFVSGGRLLSAGRDRQVVAWDLATGDGRSGRLPGRPSAIASVALSADGKLLASASWRERAINLCEGPDKVRHALRGHEGRVLGMDFSRDGKRLASFDDKGALRIWDTATGKSVLHVTKGLGNTDRGQFFLPLAFSATGERLLVGSGRGELRVVDAGTGKVGRAYTLGTELGGSAIAPDGRLVALCGGYGQPVVVLWDSVSGEVVRSWQSEQSGIYSVAFSADGRLLATAGDDVDSRVFVWEAATGQKMAAFTGHHSAVIPVAFAPDGRTLASGGGDSNIFLWDLTGRIKDGKLRPLALKAAEVEERWRLLEGDAEQAYRAAWELAASPREAVAFLGKVLRPLEALPAARLKDFLERLASEDFETRQKAGEELEAFGRGAAPALRKALEKEQPLEVRRRVERLLRGWEKSTEVLRQRRAVLALEQMGTPEARALLRKLAGGASGADLTEEARAALAR